MTSAEQFWPQDKVPTIGEQAHDILNQHYRALIKQQPKVLKEASPEPLHRLRVALRRLGTATEVFGESIRLPKGARRKQLRSLRSALGTQRDLDVLLETLQQTYRPQLDQQEIRWLDEVIGVLEQRRQKAAAQTRSLLTQAPFEKVQRAYDKWMSDPRYTQKAAFPLLSALPDLLTPLLSELLLHPGWLLTLADPREPLSEEVAGQLHDLRKVCKRVRYQAEFFEDFYGENFKSWVEEVKTLQDGLGLVQDSQVLQRMLKKLLPAKARVPQLWAILLDQQAGGLKTWQDLQPRYLDPDYRRDLHQMILAPASPTSPQPDLSTTDPDPVNDLEAPTVQKDVFSDY